jgi:transcriptional regulator with XRE-family HTH domain
MLYVASSYDKPLHACMVNLVGARKTPEQVAGERIREIRTARHLTQAALAKAMQALGYNWLQTTVAKTEAAERPLRLNEATALAGVLGIETEYLLSPPLTGLLDVSQDLREMWRLQEIVGQLDAELSVLQEEFTRKQDDLFLARQRYGEALERIRAAGIDPHNLKSLLSAEEGTDGQR